MVDRQKLIEWMNSYLNVDSFSDYCPNGLQIEGNTKINKVACAVSSSLEMIEKAIDSKADMLLVHHGLIWKGDWNTITGPYKKKVEAALIGKLNVVAYHLPLDAHLEVGNAASLARLLKQENIQPSFQYQGCNLGVQCENPLNDDEFYSIILNKINKNAICIKNRPIKKIGIVTGAGHSEFQNAINQGIDTFLTGESTEWVYHMANEFNVNFIAAGHYSTEQFGVQSLAKKINETFSVKIEYLNQNNPF